MSEINQEKIIQGILRFDYFTNEIFSQSFENFWKGEFVDRTARFLQKFNRTVRVSAKDHFKSTSLYDNFMWELIRNSDSEYDREYHYFSYVKEMAAYHIAKIKNDIKLNPYFKDLEDLKSNAEGVILYRWKGKSATFSMEPQGMLSFKRGLHCNGGVYVDDPFQDPVNKLEPVVILKVNDVMKTQVIDIPHREAFLHVVGTAQTKDDFFFDKDFLRRFEVRVLPAIQDHARKVVLWPEHMDWNELEARRGERGDKVFNQEYLCSPVYSENTFFNDDQLSGMTFQIPNFPFNQKFDHENQDMIAGWDLGKHRHPAHVSVFKLEGKGEREDREWVQVHQHFFDNEEYDKQLEYIKIVCENFGVDKLYYDDTQGQLEVLKERNELPVGFVGIQFTAKIKSAMATEFDKRRTNAKIKLIADERQRKSILAVQNDLKALETPEGHGDAFWSISLCFNYLLEPRVGIY